MFAAELCTGMRLSGHIISTKIPVNDFAAAQPLSKSSGGYANRTIESAVLYCLDISKQGFRFTQDSRPILKAVKCSQLEPVIYFRIYEARPKQGTISDGLEPPDPIVCCLGSREDIFR